MSSLRDFLSANGIAVKSVGTSNAVIATDIVGMVTTAVDVVFAQQAPG